MRSPAAAAEPRRRLPALVVCRAAPICGRSDLSTPAAERSSTNAWSRNSFSLATSGAAFGSALLLVYCPGGGEGFVLAARRFDQKHRAAVPEVAALVFAANVDGRQFSPLAAPRALTMPPRVAPERAGEDCQHDVVDCPAA